MEIAEPLTKLAGDAFKHAIRNAMELDDGNFILFLMTSDEQGKGELHRFAAQSNSVSLQLAHAYIAAHRPRFVAIAYKGFLKGSVGRSSWMATIVSGDVASRWATVFRCGRPNIPWHSSGKWRYSWRMFRIQRRCREVRAACYAYAHRRCTLVPLELAVSDEVIEHEVSSGVTTPVRWEFSGSTLFISYHALTRYRERIATDDELLAYPDKHTLRQRIIECIRRATVFSPPLRPQDPTKSQDPKIVERQKHDAKEDFTWLIFGRAAFAMCRDRASRNRWICKTVLTFTNGKITDGDKYHREARRLLRW